jgi:hypothetical protein
MVHPVGGATPARAATDYPDRGADSCADSGTAGDGANAKAEQRAFGCAA